MVPDIEVTEEPVDIVCTGSISVKHLLAFDKEQDNG